MDAQLIKNIQSYNYHRPEHETGIEIVKEIDEIIIDFSSWLNDIQQKKEEASQELKNASTQIRELEQMYLTLNSKANNLQKMIEEKNSEIRKLDGLKQMCLLRKDKATARLNQKDVDFMDSLEKRLLAFRYCTQVVWDHPNCVEGHFSGYVKNERSKKVKFFRGKHSPSEIWQLIEKMSK